MIAKIRLLLKCTTQPFRAIPTPLLPSTVLLFPISLHHCFRNRHPSTAGTSLPLRPVLNHRYSGTIQALAGTILSATAGSPLTASQDPHKVNGPAT